MKITLSYTTPEEEIKMKKKRIQKEAEEELLKELRIRQKLLKPEVFNTKR